MNEEAIDFNVEEPEPSRQIEPAHFDELLTDAPRRERKADLFGVATSVVPRLARVLAGWRGAEGVVLGLYGPWGSGKTTIFNFLREYIEESGPQALGVTYASVVEFHPWLYENHANLVASFFATIAEEVTPSNMAMWAETGKALKTMGKFLGIAAGGVSFFGLSVDAAKVMKDLGQLGTDAGEAFGLMDKGEQTLRDARRTVEQGLLSLGEDGGRVIILVDDLDRLATDELISMLRLIRLAGDLPFVTVLVALDERKVRNVLKEAGSGYGPEFLEKIIPSGIAVPYPEEDQFRSLVASQISGVLEEAGLEPPSWIAKAERTLWVGEDEIDKLLFDVRTPRDLTRLLNALRILFLSTVDDPDLDADDALWLEILHVFHSDIYEVVRTSRAFVTWRERRDLVERRTGAGKERRAKLLETIFSKASADESAAARVHWILNRLFGDLADTRGPSDRDRQLAAGRRRLRDPESFGRYFGLQRPPQYHTKRQVIELVKALVEDAKENRMEAIADQFAALNELSSDVSRKLIRDMSLAFARVDPPIMASIGTGLNIALPRIQVQTGQQLAEMIVRRIAGPEDYFRFNQPEREHILEEYLPKVVDALSLPASSWLVSALGNDLRRPDLFNRARRDWLMRLNKEIETGNQVVIMDDPELIWDQALRVWISVSSADPRPELPALAGQLTEHIQRSPERLIGLTEHAQKASQQWNEYDRGAHIERMREVFGPEMINAFIDAIGDHPLVPGRDSLLEALRNGLPQSEMVVDDDLDDTGGVET
ncbi:MAG TPA: P-loop NTPase fold protein [Longimicrobiaceae bacterium]|nr:P-loop NTPase fold protein [Longimicrobiaceae bacterium]